MNHPVKARLYDLIKKTCTDYCYIKEWTIPDSRTTNQKLHLFLVRKLWPKTARKSLYIEMSKIKILVIVLDIVAISKSDATVQWLINSNWTYSGFLHKFIRTCSVIRKKSKIYIIARISPFWICLLFEKIMFWKRRLFIDSFVDCLVDSLAVIVLIELVEE
jgi:hypothetical protein